MKFSYNQEKECIEVENTSAEDCLLDIIHLAVDYDGQHSVKGLKKLIDEMRALADKGLTLGITEGKWETNLFEESQSHEEAREAMRQAKSKKENI